MSDNLKNIKDKGKIAMINAITDNYEEEAMELILDVIESMDSEQENLKERLEEKILGMKIEDMETLKEFIGEVKAEHRRLKSIEEYQATPEFYGETEEEYMSRIKEILQRIGKNKVEKNLIGYMCSVLGMIKQSNPKNPIIVETSVVEDILEPIISGVIEEKSVRKIDETINTGINNFFNSDFLYSPFKSNVDGEEYRLVTPTPEVYTLMTELPNIMERIIKEEVFNGKGVIKKVTLKPFSKKEHTHFLIEMDYKGESKNNPLLEKFRVNPEFMSKVYLIGIEDYGKALEYFEEVLSMSVATNMEKYIKSKIEGVEFYV